MSRIDDLITELVPKGVEFRPLSELLNYEQPTKYLMRRASDRRVVGLVHGC